MWRVGSNHSSSKHLLLPRPCMAAERGRLHRENRNRPWPAVFNSRQPEQLTALQSRLIGSPARAQSSQPRQGWSQSTAACVCVEKDGGGSGQVRCCMGGPERRCREALAQHTSTQAPTPFFKRGVLLLSNARDAVCHARIINGHQRVAAESFVLHFVAPTCEAAHSCCL